LSLQLPDVGAGNERAASTGEYDAANILSHARVVDGGAELGDRAIVESVELVRPVDRDGCDPVSHFKSEEVVGRHVLNISPAGWAAFLLRSPDMRQTWLSRRGRKPGHFSYVTSSGNAVSARRAAQIDALAIPPGWTDVHVAAGGRSAIQAWGFDARGRKQYRYHPDAVKRGQRRKHYRVRQMARDLPDIRRRVYADFARHGMSRE
jgi:hypothetical protein